MRHRVCMFVLCLLHIAGYAQEKFVVTVINGQTSEALELVTISSNGKYLATTDSLGKAQASLPRGMQQLRFSLVGYNKLDTNILFPLSDTLRVSMWAVEELSEVVVIASTRADQGIENSPLKVEVMDAEDMKEEAGLKPGNIASILGDVSGVQIQQSSAVSGNSNIRIQGLDGRYTQVLRDGMPLYEGFAGGFGILTTPPLDLKQIELIKGSASTLYGGGAIGGLVNLISKRPLFKPELDALINYTTLREGNVNFYAAKRNKKLGYNLFAGYTNMRAVDVNKDGFSDVPGASSLVVHPRLFFYPSSKTILSVGYSGAFDNRKGGDMLVLDDHPDVIHQFYESDRSNRHAGEYVAEYNFNPHAKLTVKGNISNFNLHTNTNTESIHGSQTSYYNEVSLFTSAWKGDIVAGINLTGDVYKTLIPDTAQLKNFKNNTEGIFTQYSLHLKTSTIIEAGLRLDHHDDYGFFLLPRIAILQRLNDHWAARAGFGMGYKTPNPLVNQNIEYSVLSLKPVNAALVPEFSYGYNAEVNYKKEWNKHTSLFINQAFFLTQVTRPVLFQQNAAGFVDLVNATAPIVSKGFDTYIKLQLQTWELYLGYTFTDARNTYLSFNTFVPLTPKNRWAFVLAKEISERWRIGLEGSYTGGQYRYDGTATPAYFFMAAVVRYNISKHLSLVLNCENLLDYRMSKVEALYTGSISNPTFKPLWAPIDGRVVNLSVRWQL